MELSLTGFRSYPSRVTVDFTGKSLAAALGDTGAGKSSLLDAITYALFRKSSWDAREVRLLIADGAEAMSVEFIFLHDGHRWKVQRTMHARNPNAGRHHLTNLDTGHEQDGASAVDVRIRTVLGMGYDTFLRVGLLPQGKFDQLLTAAPKDRNERLRELFGTDALESVRTGAIRHRESLTDLLAEARIKRRAMPDDPAQAAEAAGVAAGAAEAAAERLGSTIDIISSLQNRHLVRPRPPRRLHLAQTLRRRPSVPGAGRADRTHPRLGPQQASGDRSLGTRATWTRRWRRTAPETRRELTGCAPSEFSFGAAGQLNRPRYERQSAPLFLAGFREPP